MSVDKSDPSWFIDNSDLDKKIATLGTKAELKAEQKKKNFFQNFKHLIPVISMVKAILKMMTPNIF